MLKNHFLKIRLAKNNIEKSQSIQILKKLCLRLLFIINIHQIKYILFFFNRKLRLNQIQNMAKIITVDQSNKMSIKLGVLLDQLRQVNMIKRVDSLCIIFNKFHCSVIIGLN